MATKIKVLAIDDSALIRQLLTKIVNSDPALEMVGTAANPILAENKVKNLKPDIITLDIEMPEMDGITYLKKLMLNNPIPVIMFSSLLDKHRELALDALNIGAFDYVIKPSANVRDGVEELATDLVEKIKNAYANRAKFYRKHGVTMPTDTTPTVERTPISLEAPKTAGFKVYQKNTADIILPLTPSRETPMDKIILIGSSTGGTEALIECLKNVTPSAPPIVIAQHMPEHFTTSFAKRLNSILKIDVAESEDGMSIGRGQAVLARGAKHTMIKAKGGKYYIEVRDGEPVTRHKPSVDVLFRSGAVYAKNKAIGIILTGMGDDGANGMKEMKDAGAYNIAQNEETCTVFGMPREAIARGGVDE
ncbi:protein-glutamate methylesterase/protein-glutamine glutaminase, partial [Brachyspira hampsonii]|uniref:protein-glutamate methylesterase/protein-glutamine glutaminase n=1 Tax=Brachyspira hampsonii TaxID=1287055 RepID=UPI001C668119